VSAFGVKLDDALFECHLGDWSAQKTRDIASFDLPFKAWESLFGLSEAHGVHLNGAR
jgi:hypothetical protein